MPEIGEETIQDLTTVTDIMIGHRLYKIGNTLISKIYRRSTSGKMIVDIACLKGIKDKPKPI